MNETLPYTTISNDATLFREEAERAWRNAAAMIDKKVVRSVERDRRAL